MAIDIRRMSRDDLDRLNAEGEGLAGAQCSTDGGSGSRAYLDPSKRWRTASVVMTIDETRTFNVLDETRQLRGTIEAGHLQI
jgi:hypothetical protein